MAKEEKDGADFFLLKNHLEVFLGLHLLIFFNVVYRHTQEYLTHTMAAKVPTTTEAGES